MRFLSLKLVEAPDGLPVSIDEFIDHARLNGLTVDRQPALVERELRAATIRAEQYIRRALMTQRLAALYAPEPCDGPGARLIVLPRGQAQSVESVRGLADGEELDAGAWRFDGWNIVTLVSFPADPVEVTWLGGYGDTAEAVPDPIREGIYEYATVLYENRNGARETKYQADAEATLPKGIKDLWRPFQIEVSG